MGLLMRRRRPLMRVMAGAAVGTVAYKAGERTASSAPGYEPAGEAPAMTAKRLSVSHGAAAELNRLAQLHATGALTDAEFAAAKSQLLGT